MNLEEDQDLPSITNVTGREYPITLMVFLFAYTLFEVPANYFLKLLGPSKWFALILVCWVGISMAMGGVQNYGGLATVRFLVGLFEAGLSPGLAYYVSFWYRANERPIRLAFIYSTTTLTDAFGGVLAFGISHLNDVGSLQGWK